MILIISAQNVCVEQQLSIYYHILNTAFNQYKQSITRLFLVQAWLD